MAKISQKVGQSVLVVIMLGLCGVAVWFFRGWHSQASQQALVSQALSVASTTSRVNILIVGDIMLDRNVRSFMAKNGSLYPFAHIRQLLADEDVVLGNLEGAITRFPSKTEGKNHAPLIFTFATSSAAVLKEVGMTIVSLANNHSFNFGEAGLMETKKWLTESGVEFFGDPNNNRELSQVVEKNGYRLGFVGYHQFAEQGYDKVISEIQLLRPRVDFLIVMPHWGVEYNKNFTKDQQKKAHEFIDAGADLVIGAHPHVVEPTEVYHNKAIFYSLGNFIFDQDFSYETTHGLAVRVVLDQHIVQYQLIPLSIVKSQPAASDITGGRNFSLSR